jgi:hypothetical protein
MLEALGSILNTVKTNLNQFRCCWLMPVILATWEAKIRRIEVRS